MRGLAKLFDSLVEFLEPPTNAKHLSLQVGSRRSRALAPSQFCDNSMFEITDGRFHFEQRPPRTLAAGAGG